MSQYTGKAGCEVYGNTDTAREKKNEKHLD